VTTSNRLLIFIPTYNEAEYVANIFRRIRALDASIDILFLDDNSPDGTGNIIDMIKEQNQGVFAIHRTGKLGIGSAHKRGIEWAYDNRYDLLLTMDCDFTHSPEDIPTFINLSTESDVVIGSRYLRPGSLKDWSVFRRMLTGLGHRLTVSLLDMKYDASGAYRLYRLDHIPPQVFDRVYSNSYSFFFESLYIIMLNKHKIVEFPIDLPSRTYGHSKMCLRDMFQSVLLLVYLFLKTKLDREALLCTAISERGASSMNLSDNSCSRDWDSYWKPKHTVSGAIYDLIASFYRKVFIRPTLERFLKKYFKPNSKLLHAGCGGGQCDSVISREFWIVPLDISFPALSRYYDYSDGKCAKVCGDLMNLPAVDGCFDGVYNLGVMEYFDEDQIRTILMEFSRVLKSEGRVVLFWPPRFGLSVMFLKSVHFIVNRLMRKSLKLHPEEITLVSSRKQVENILESAGFTLVEYHFGAYDFFTHVVVVAQRTKN